MIYMLDTNILIYLIKKRPAEVGQRINRLSADDSLCMSFITYAELLKRVERSVHRAEVLLQLEALTEQVPVRYQIDAGLCSHYARHSARLREAGTPIGANDLWIACHALALACVLVSNNLREFRRIDGLLLENWAEA